MFPQHVQSKEQITLSVNGIAGGGRKFRRKSMSGGDKVPLDPGPGIDRRFLMYKPREKHTVKEERLVHYLDEHHAYHDCKNACIAIPSNNRAEFDLRRVAGHCNYSLKKVFFPLRYVSDTTQDIKELGQRMVPYNDNWYVPNEGGWLYISYDESSNCKYIGETDNIIAFMRSLAHFNPRDNKDFPKWIKEEGVEKVSKYMKLLHPEYCKKLISKAFWLPDDDDEARQRILREVENECQDKNWLRGYAEQSLIAAFNPKFNIKHNGFLTNC